MNLVTRPNRKALRTCARIAKEHGVTVRDMVKPFGSKQVVLAKQCAMYELRMNHQWAFKRIAEFFGLKDHGTAIHACRKIQRLKDRRIMIHPAQPDDIQDPFDGCKPLTGVSITICAPTANDPNKHTVLGSVFAPNIEKLKEAIRFVHGANIQVNLADVRPCQVKIQKPD